MPAPLLARAILTAIAAGQGLAPLFIDLNRTHATHPNWPGHARFHIVWQTFTLALTAPLEVALVWWPGPTLCQRFYLVAVLAALPIAGFLIALFARRLYRGTLHDPNGIQPARIRTRNGIVEVDMNLVLVAIASVMLVVAVRLF